ncbi:uncharacterized protein DC041_0009610 [Schistosoma bovis]|uniref:Uncharacterized protein n=1 Tax=Schistosoma bovis TaxID=6184 RepID=A0A430QHY7_SCHBO|nr:uncharacterized protein DC041_0009610 [Schistosoma bovis]
MAVGTKKIFTYLHASATEMFPLFVCLFLSCRSCGKTLRISDVVLLAVRIPHSTSALYAIMVQRKSTLTLSRKYMSSDIEHHANHRLHQNILTFVGGCPGHFPYDVKGQYRQLNIRYGRQWYNRKYGRCRRAYVKQRCNLENAKRLNQTPEIQNRKYKLIKQYLVQINKTCDVIKTLVNSSHTITIETTFTSTHLTLPFISNIKNNATCKCTVLPLSLSLKCEQIVIWLLRLMETCVECC